MGRKALELTGRVFDRLTVLRRDGDYRHKAYRESMWQCICSCGVEKAIRGSRLLSKQARSCGCLRRDLRATFGPRVSQFKKKDGTAARNVYSHYQTRARRKSLEFALSFDGFLLLSQQPCAYCGESLSNQTVTPAGELFRYNGVDRVDSHKGYTEENCVACCGWCNIAKFDLSAEDFVCRCKRVAEYAA